MTDSYGPGGPASTAGLSRLGALVRGRDPDRFLTALFAPPPLRETLFTLYAFNAEMTRAWRVASHPTLALIRLQWWRDVLEGAPRRHEVADPLQAEIVRGRLPAADLLALLAAHEAAPDAADPPENGQAWDGRAWDCQAWQAYVLATSGALARLAGRVLGAAPAAEARLAALGGAYGVAMALRRAARPGVSRPPPDLAAWAQTLLGRPRALARTGRSPGLVGVLARRDLARLDGARLDRARLDGARLDRARLAAGVSETAARGLGDRLAVTLAALTGRI